MHPVPTRLGALLLALLPQPAGAPGAAAQKPVEAAAFRSPYARWPNSLPADPDFFPIGVWLQSPRNARAYAAIGVNLYVGLWRGPTPEQLAELRRAGMPVVCAQNEVGLSQGDGVIVGWLHQDEPDNAQPKKGGGYGPPVRPEEIRRLYDLWRRRDPTRPVFLNLGQGVADDEWVGRGPRTGHPEDYPRYLAGTDIVSFDIYPVTSNRPNVRGRLELVAKGIERLGQWSKHEKLVWAVLECTRIGSTQRPTPAQVRSELWMALIHGARGIVWFCHEWKPRFREDALLHDPEMKAAVAALNARLRALAAVLNSPDRPELARVHPRKKSVPIALMVKEHAGSIWLFAVSLANKPAGAAFVVRGLPSRAEAVVLDERRRIPISLGRFHDDFPPYGVHLYRIEKQGLRRRGR